MIWMPKDRLVLKKTLYQDQAKIMSRIVGEKDEDKKSILKEALDMINNYILICVQRNKF